MQGFSDFIKYFILGFIGGLIFGYWWAWNALMGRY